jgi:hypothetical protein
MVNTKDGMAFEGAVLGTGSKTERIMSDVYADVTYAVVFDGSVVKNVPVWNSEFPTTNSVTLDATDEVFEAARAFFIADELTRMNREYENSVNQRCYNAMKVEKGKDVVVARGRKVAKGTSGRVFWMGDNGWGMSVGIELADGTRVFTAAKNVDVMNPDEYLDLEELMLTPDYSGQARREGNMRLRVFEEQRARADARKAA